jgi:hypothetical protein
MNEDEKAIKVVIAKLEHAFKLINKENEEAAKIVMYSIKTLTDIIKEHKEIQIDPLSKAFAVKHKPLCDKIIDMIEKEGIESMLFLSDHEGKNMITSCKMNDNNITRSISGIVFKSDTLYKAILHGIGLPQSFIRKFAQARKSYWKSKKRKDN